jgi:hypothetical protein
LLDTVLLVGPALLMLWRRGFRTPPTHRLKRLLRRELIQAVYFTVPTALVGGTPGQVAVGLRVVDAGTLQRVGWKKATARWVIWAVPGFLVNAYSALVSDRLQAETERRVETVRAGLEDVERQHPDDEKERAEATVELYRSAGVYNIACLNQVLFGLAVVLAHRLVGGRGARDRWTNTRVVAVRS